MIHDTLYMIHYTTILFPIHPSTIFIASSLFKYGNLAKRLRLYFYIFLSFYRKMVRDKFSFI